MQRQHALDQQLAKDELSTTSSLLDTDPDMALEDVIDMQDLQLQDFTEKTSSFRLGQTNHKISEAG